ncbi:MAG: pilus assembly protein [Planctomycetaceae bacterium]|nr:pilus assembly protein [Planctomycetaceae bacterium]
MFVKRPSKTTTAHRRSGAALVEFSLVLPVLLFILVGCIESCSMIYLKQTLHIASYEGARVALVPKTSAAQVEFAAEQILKDRRVRKASITISPSNWATAPINTLITVKVDAPSNANFAVPLMFFRNQTITGHSTMMKEY